MDRRQQEQLDELTERAFQQGGLDDIDHRRLTRLIGLADAEKSLPITGESRDRAIFTAPGGGLLSGPHPGSSGKRPSIWRRQICMTTTTAILATLGSFLIFLGIIILVGWICGRL